jgi:hypothetical protein
VVLSWRNVPSPTAFVCYDQPNNKIDYQQAGGVGTEKRSFERISSRDGQISAYSDYMISHDEQLHTENSFLGAEPFPCLAKISGEMTL